MSNIPDIIIAKAKENAATFGYEAYLSGARLSQSPHALSRATGGGND